MAKDTALRCGKRPRKRHASLSSFFNKMLPSNHPEQGGTARSHDMKMGEPNSAYGELAMNPNELTGWNLAQNRSPRPQHRGASAQSQHCSGQNCSMERGRTRVRDDTGEVPQVPQRTWSFGTVPPSLPLKSPGLNIVEEGILNKVREREDIRKHRRGLKESGDWLGVQGADPYSGEFAVLTPTSTLSSEITPPHTRERLAELAQMKEFARLAYDQAKCEEETEREIARLMKGKSKLEKIEGAKKELRQRRELPVWVQHKQQWSSAAEPDLSPIPQSLRSCERETDFDNFGAAFTPNSPRLSNPRGGFGTPDQPKPVDDVENAEPSKTDHRQSPTTDTIVHNSLANTDFPDTSIKTTKMFYPSGFSDAVASPSQAQRARQHFLCRRRRRPTDHGELIKHPSSQMTQSSAGMTEKSLMFDSNVDLPPLPQGLTLANHFNVDPPPPPQGILIRDDPLHLVPCQEQMANIGISSEPIKRVPFLETATRPAQRSHSETRKNLALQATTNLFGRRHPKTNHPRSVLEDNEATVISYQSMSRRNTKSTPGYQRIIPVRSSSAQTKLARAGPSQIQNHGASQIQSSLDIDLLGHTQATQDLRRPNTQESPRTVHLEDYINSQMTESHQRDLRGSVFTPTIITTGSDPDPDPDPPHSLGGTPSRVECWEKREGMIVGNDDKSLTTPNSQSCEWELSSASTTDDECIMTPTSSRPTSPQRNSQSIVPAHTTPETGIVSTGPATCPKPPAQHDEANQNKDIQLKISKMNEADPPSHPNKDEVKLALQRRAPYVHREAMVRAAARIAILRSRTGELAATSTHTPNPPTRDAQKEIPTITSAKRKGGGGRTLERDNIRVIDASLPLEQDAERRNRPCLIVMFVSYIITVVMVAIGRACVVWSVIKPIFDARSQLQRRDPEDLAAAGLFIVIGCLTIAAAVRAVLWIACHLWDWVS